MNRLPSFASSIAKLQCCQSDAHPQRRLQPRSPRAFFLPGSYEPNYRYPLVVWLHDAGECETQVARLMPHLSDQNYVAVGVRGTQSTEIAGQGFGWSESETGIALAEQAVFDAVEAAQSRFAVEPERIFIAGFRQGGTMAVRLGLRHPGQFAGALSMCGAFPRSGRVLAELEHARQVPLFLALGSESPTYPVEALCDDLRVMHTARLRAEIRQYPGGDELCDQILRDTDAWIMAQITGHPALQPPAAAAGPGIEFSAN